MPQNITVDDRSPLVNYSGNWVANFKQYPLNDTMSDRYYDSTFHSSKSPGDSVSVKFNGTAIYIYGAMRPDRGYYTVTVDDGQKLRLDAYASKQPNGDDGLFRQLLFSKADLEDRHHEVTLTNDSHERDARPFVDIDYIMWTSSVKTNAGASDFDDGHPSWKFNGNWTMRAPNATNNQTVHSTRSETIGSYATLTFQGDAIYFYGPIGRAHGLYNITLDNQEPITLNGLYTRAHAETILYFADSLGPGPHELMVTNIENKVFSVDYARVL
ncbi:hypothetical protein B0J17DRAFT_603553, partial [Rhizoctonia solani]